jgi:hypothetical protein
MKLYKLAQEYFIAFSKKNIEKLESLLSRNIMLRDWSVRIKGKKKVVNFNKKLFAEYPKHNKKFLNYCLNIKKKIITCEVEIYLNKKINIKVVDIIFFDANYKIKKIYAFKG